MNPETDPAVSAKAAVAAADQALEHAFGRRRPDEAEAAGQALAAAESTFADAVPRSLSGLHLKTETLAGFFAYTEAGDTATAEGARHAMRHLRAIDACGIPGCEAGIDALAAILAALIAGDTLTPEGARHALRHLEAIDAAAVGAFAP